MSTVTLPPSNTNAGQLYILQCSSYGELILAPTGGDTINDLSGPVTVPSGATVVLYSTGANKYSLTNYATLSNDPANTLKWGQLFGTVPGLYAPPLRVLNSSQTGAYGGVSVVASGLYNEAEITFLTITMVGTGSTNFIIQLDDPAEPTIPNPIVYITIDAPINPLSFTGAHIATAFLPVSGIVTTGPQTFMMQWDGTSWNRIL